MRVAILGSGNIGTDLMYKVREDDHLELAMVAGVDPQSDGLAHAIALGHATTTDGLDGILALEARPDLVFDATSARSHLEHAPRLADAGIRAIDLTPAGVGPMVVPAVNMAAHADEPNINLVSCAAQATVPMVAAIRGAVDHVRYAEIVSTVASRSAGPGTRQNIDEFTHKTRKALEALGGAERGKTIAIFNPAEPPIHMQNTIYALVDGEIDVDRIGRSVQAMAEEVRRYVPGYAVVGPTIVGDKVAVFVTVAGAGHYLPTYAGNLDIITAAATGIASRLAARLESTAP